MIPSRFWIAALVAVWSAMPVWADTGPTDDARTLAAKIDRYIAARWEAEKVTPAAPADDGVFLRRLSLDVIGRIPSVAETRRFLRDPASDKRERVVERMLDSPGYVTNFSNIWRDLLMPEAQADFQQRFFAASMERWLRKQFTDNVAYDRMVRELIVMPLPNNRNGMRNVFYGQEQGEPTPLAYYQSKQGKPENLAASTARLFLGIRLECAQCHNHPFGRWTREQFWEQAAFFGGIRSQGRNGIYSPLSEVADRRELAIPNTERVAQARFLDGKEPQWRYKDSARNTLAEWMTAADNPFFAKAAVNRLWAHFFGVGLVDPVDDFNDENKPSHPELLDELARQFIRHDFDYRFMIRAITLSKTYQLASVPLGAPPPDVHLFASVPVRGLSQDQLLESVSLLTGTPNLDANRRQQNFFDPSQSRFSEKFVNQDKRTEYQTSIPQALVLMNGTLIADATHPQRSQFLAAVANAPFLDTDGRIETLYLAALSRKPRPDEAEKHRRYIENGGASKDAKAALGDVFWALLNSPEFFLNH